LIWTELNILQKKKNRIFLLLLVSCVCFLCVFFTKKDSKQMTISKFTEARVPCIEVTIENQTLSAELDLGFSGVIEFSQDFLNTLREKTLQSSKTMCGIRGKKYETNIYELPSMQIGDKTFVQLLADERTYDFKSDATIGDSTPPSKGEDCVLGWKLFENTNLLLDLRKGKIAFCENASDLERQGYDLSRCAQVPLTTERGLLEIDVETTRGILRCILDTGATYNVLNTSLKEDQNLNDAYTHPEDEFETPFLLVNGTNLGPAKFLCLPFNLPIHIDGLLGVDFFMKNWVYLDFKKKEAYIAPETL
jgi:hypothetical protein